MKNNIQACFFALLASLILLTSCDEPPYFSEVQPVDPSGWHLEDRKVFEVEIQDTVTLHNLYLHIRHRGSYDYSNIYFFFHINFPNGKTAKDTIECPLADYQGKWLGNKAGDIVSHDVLIKYRSQFPLAGDYTFELEHAMRDEELLDVTDVGLVIEEVK